jgi:cytidylate kinase
LVVGHNVVCISRQDGARGHEVAVRVAESLGFRLIDEDIITQAAVEAGVDHEVVADVERRKSALVRLVEGLGSSGMGATYMAPPNIASQDQPASDELRGLIRSVIEETATKGSAVIVAHAASLALAQREDVLRVFVTASPPTRAERVASTLGVDEKQAGRAIKRSDAERADYIKRFYGVDAELPTHYDLVINTDRLAPDDAARLIVEWAGRAVRGTTPRPLPS